MFDLGSDIHRSTGNHEVDLKTTLTDYLRCGGRDWNRIPRAPFFLTVMSVAELSGLACAGMVHIQRTAGSHLAAWTECYNDPASEARWETRMSAWCCWHDQVIQLPGTEPASGKSRCHCRGTRPRPGLCRVLGASCHHCGHMYFRAGSLRCLITLVVYRLSLIHISEPTRPY